jgi:hypothetical protein
MTRFPDLFSALSAPFDEGEVRSRNQSGKVISYITARTAMNRLDTILGPENWWDEYLPGENSVLCRLTVRLPDGQVLTKADAGGYAGMSDQGDDDKSGFSDAFKRASVKFGIARYLYRDGVPSFAGPAVEAVEPATDRRLAELAGSPPAGKPVVEPARIAPVPAAASPAGAIPVQSTPRGQWGNGQGQTSGTSGPKSGRALFAWVKEQEQRSEVGLLKYLNSWAKLQDFPGRMVDFDADQIRLAHAEAVRKLASIPASRGDAYEEALAN